MNDAYTLLAERKTKNKSFSEVIRKLATKKKDIMELAETWGHFSEKEINEMKTNIKKQEKRQPYQP